MPRKATLQCFQILRLSPSVTKFFISDFFFKWLYFSFCEFYFCCCTSSVILSFCDVSFLRRCCYVYAFFLWLLFSLICFSLFFCNFLCLLFFPFYSSWFVSFCKLEVSQVNLFWLLFLPCRDCTVRHVYAWVLAWDWCDIKRHDMRWNGTDVMRDVSAAGIGSNCHG